MFPRRLTEWLFNPTEPTGGSPAPGPHPDLTRPPAAAPAPAPVAATPPPAPAAPTVITLTPEQYESMRAAAERLRTIEAEAAEKLEAERRRAVEAQAATGEVQKAFELERSKWQKDLAEAQAEAARIETERLRDRQNADLATLLSGVEWASPAAAADARTLLDLRFEPVRDPVTKAVTVREKGTGRTAQEAVAAWLASDQAAHYLRPTARGGSGARGGDVPAPAASDTPKTWADAAIEAERQRRAAAGAGYGLVYTPPAKAVS